MRTTQSRSRRPLLAAPALLALLATTLLACAGPRPEPSSPAVPPPATTPPPAPTSAEPAPADTAAPAEPAPPTPLADAYREPAARILQAALADQRAFDKLAYLSDHIGHRLSGSRGLEQAVAWTQEVMRREGHENVRAEKVMVPHWVRGAESASMLAPYSRPLTILGLGNSVGTGPRGVTGEVIVIDDFDALEARAAEVKGKIVLFNKAMAPYGSDGPGYGEVAGYRVGGPSRAAAHGAKAVLMRSLTADSLNTPHTGTLVYSDDAPKLPAAAITIEDAAFIARLRAAGKPVRVRLNMGARMLPDAESANVIGELVGSEKPDEIVLISAHLDSWDVGQGAHDDGGSCVTMMHALTVLRELGLRPRRTIRVVLYTNEENGLRGSKAYAEQHADEIAKHVMALESDSGSFRPLGFRVQADATALAQTQDILSLLAPIGATKAAAGYSGADIMNLARAGVPALGVSTEGARYFHYHHTHADTLDKVEPEDVARAVALVAIAAYVIADMPERFGGERAATAPAQGDGHEH
ncbi:M20/M25/M40 family metallo-hydrolase [Haliangium ochraceum]|uniref:Carboxypeptidase Q n=1 Tax=Haliangium ochraceum (strain DSM 14365 / JCM 11303 / SMP-2) TaxID=502025 RepID=D0LM08_HALO1|nr:M20/M25/M40 family metallo-hydrolase [Haliangium ochraceum]ACY15186.1 peptidase M28 [Haliangium ochraceum DSM 14365]